ncbi:MAG: hypothetical protein JF587_14240, partial [Catenulisporales bacterium]|nr:hypothetical protein [Catenulisporales bacterium]
MTRSAEMGIGGAESGSGLAAGGEGHLAGHLCERGRAGPGSDAALGIQATEDGAVAADGSDRVRPASDDPDHISEHRSESSAGSAASTVAGAPITAASNTPNLIPLDVNTEPNSGALVPTPIPATAFAQAWAAALSAAAASPLGHEQALGVVTPLAEQVVAMPDDPEFARKLGEQAAGVLIDAHCFQGACVAASVEAMDRHLPPFLRSQTRTALRAGLASAFAEGLRERTRVEQASIHEAVLTAYRAGEARFRTVFRNAALGIVITDRHGQVLEVN